MPRSPRIEFPGAMYHVLARGNRHEPIVLADDDRWMFLRTLGEMAERTEIRVHAYALMDNHYHLVIETPKANLVAGMKWFQTTYTQRFNANLREFGFIVGLLGDKFRAASFDRNVGFQFRLPNLAFFFLHDSFGVEFVLANFSLQLDCHFPPLVNRFVGALQ